MFYGNIIFFLSSLLILQTQFGFRTDGVILGNRYTIRRGDSLRTIAERFCGSPNRLNDIKVLNYITDQTLYPGRIIVLPPDCVSFFTNVGLANRAGVASDLQRSEIEGIGTSNLKGGTKGISNTGQLGIGNLENRRVGATMKEDKELEILKSRIKSVIRNFGKLDSEDERAIAVAAVV